MTEPPQERDAASSLGAIRALLWFLGLASLGLAAYAGWQVWLALQDGYELYWNHFWLAIYVLVGLALVYLIASTVGPFLLRFRSFLRDARSRAERLRAAAIAGDERLAPLASVQPEPLPTAELPIHPVTFGPFGLTKRNPARSWIGQSLAMLLVAVVVTAIIGAAFVIVMPVFDSDPIGAWMSPMFLILLILFAFMVLISLVGFIVVVVQRMRGGRRVERPQFVADDWGLRATDGRRKTEQEQPIPWHGIRAFYKADDILHLRGSTFGKGTPQSTTFTIATADRTLSWTLREDATDEQRAENERLCRLIATRTSLSLRDMTATSTQFATSLLEMISPFLPPGYRLSIEEQTGSPGLAPPRTRVRRLGSTWPRWLRVSRIALLILALGGAAVGLIAQQIQGYQYLDLLDQHIDREAPYYTIDFRTNDGAWPNHSATADDGSYSFRADGYYMTGAPAGRAMEALLPEQYGDATVELTAALQGGSPASDIGVVLRESADGADKVIFTLSASGGWMLARVHAGAGATPQRVTLMSNDHSGAVQTGKDAYNFLAVIMRGGDYLCYVRDQLVGIYHDTSSQTPTQGHVGLWLGDSHAVGVFYYFSVYPAR